MKYTILTGALALLFFAAAPAAIAQTPALLNYQGRVQTGTPPADFTGTGQFKFALVDQTPVPFLQATGAVLLKPNQSLTGATIVALFPGTGYTTAPAVTVSAPQVPGGVQATVTAIVSNGSVTGFTVVNGGSGYTALPTLTIAPPPAPTPTITWNNNGPAPDAPINAVSLPVTSGLYSVLLGDTSINNMAAIPPSVFSRPDVRLRVWFNGQQLSPDQRLAPNGYFPSGAVFPGNVGIGTSSPAARLQVDSPGNALPAASGSTQSVGLIARLKAAGAADAGLDIGSADTGGFWLQCANRGSLNVNYSLLLNPNGGNVGIGTTNPTLAKLVVQGFVNRTRTGNVGYYGSNYYNYGIPDTYGNTQTSIWATSEVVAAAFIALSDSRIKSVTGRSNPAEDLSKLRAIEITDYTYLDKVAHGDRPQKKVIAQQVEKVFPQAVNRQVNTVPDIYKKAPVDGSWIKLATDLKTGERVKFITPENAESIHEVLEVRDEAFRTAFTPESKEIFVYGREVNDFRTVDYEAIAMLNVSATQELARQLEAEKGTTAALKERLARLEAKDADRDAKLAALMKMMEDRGGEAEAATVSTVTAQP